jgi:hypothetical protein
MRRRAPPPPAGQERPYVVQKRVHHGNYEQRQQRRSDEDPLAARRALDAELRPYRGKMSAPQLAMLEDQYLERRLLEAAGLPRLSLFYLR